MPLFFNIASLASVCLLGWLYTLGIDNSYFWIYPWYDIPLHLLGGFTIGLWCMAVAARRRVPALRALLLAAAITLPVLVAWEVWEYWASLTSSLPNFWADTLQDIGNGAVGAVAAWCIYAAAKPR